ncbi:hypothetical protein MKW98_032582 [Papaver atlanticum]|uniref:Secoisolariciresinol dehydrogenase n=1 Tax=Papaver atlanticum TaxID=357466 RepID=A0AAD4SWR6_9MAGN|nr:hypothetical protein MKW98_032582 [Papaver atlanticum]
MANASELSITNHPIPNLLPLTDRVAIVTGASRGIADLLAEELNNNSSSSSSSSQPRAVAIRANISDPDQVKSLFDQTEQVFGSTIHILVNCAGILDPKYPSVAITSVEDWDSTFNVNTKGVFLCCKEAANRLTRGGGGRIISISTSLVAGLTPGYATYAASKAAVEIMVKILAKELKGTGITANCIAPGPIATELFYAGKTEETIKRFADMSPMNRLGETKDVAPVVGFVSSDSGEWINGQVIRVNGGSIV